MLTRIDSVFPEILADIKQAIEEQPESDEKRHRLEMLAKMEEETGIKAAKTAQKEQV